MAHSFTLQLFVVIFSVIGLERIHGASLEVEEMTETVTFKLYRTLLQSWQVHENEYKARLVIQANVHCAQYPAFCGLLSWEDTPTGTFTDSMVFVNAVTDGKDLSVSTYMTYPTGANVSSVAGTQFVLSKTTTQGLIRNIRTEVADLTNTYVTYIGTEYFGIPPSTLMNMILIPIALAVLLFTIFMAVGLHCWNKQRQKKKVSKEISSSKVSPIHSLGGATGKNVNTHINFKGCNINNTEKKSHLSKKEISAPDESVNKVIEMDETCGQNTQPLVPLTVDEAHFSDKKEQKKKKKKKRRHHRAESSDTGQEQDINIQNNLPQQDYGHGHQGLAESDHQC